jgi:hypothetical protein
VRAVSLVDRERAHHAVSVLCSVLEVTRQGYYAWRATPAVSSPAARRGVEGQEMLALYARSRDTFDAPRIRDRLQIEACIRIGQKRDARLMRELGIKGTGKGRRVRTIIPDRRAALQPAVDELAGADRSARSLAAKTRSANDWERFPDFRIRAERSLTLWRLSHTVRGEAIAQV